MELLLPRSEDMITDLRLTLRATSGVCHRCRCSTMLNDTKSATTTNKFWIDVQLRYGDCDSIDIETWTTLPLPVVYTARRLFLLHKPCITFAYESGWICTGDAVTSCWIHRRRSHGLAHCCNSCFSSISSTCDDCMSNDTLGQLAVCL
jgi:hypothetical protein